MTIAPNVKTKKTFLATIGQNAGSSVACIVIPKAYKGPVGYANTRLITSLQELYDNYGPATSANYESWFAAEGYLKHGNQLWVARAMPADATYAYIDIPAYGTASAGTSASAQTVGSQGEGIDFDTIGSLSLPDNVALRIHARGPGTYANTDFRVGVIPASAWTSVPASAASAVNVPDYWDVEYGPSASDELLILVSITDGDGTEKIVERWLVSTTTTKKTHLDEAMYIPDHINNRSEYIAVSHNPGLMPATISGAGTFSNLGGGTETGTVSDSMIQTCYGFYQNELAVEIDMFIDGGKSVAVKRYIAGLAGSRGDAVALLDVPLSVVTSIEGMIDWAANTLNLNTTYAALYGNWGKVYDRYNDKHRWVPLAGHVAGAFAYNDEQAGHWFAPAGLNRGLLNDIEELKIYPNRAQQDLLYQARINPIMLGSGIAVWGQKTLGVSESAYSRLNVRRLYTVLKRAVRDISYFYMFEPNDRLVRSNISDAISTYLEDIRGQQGIYEYQVICNEINNPPEAIDRNEIHVDVIIKPAKFIEFAVMNFVEVRDEKFFSEGIEGGFPSIPGGGGGPPGPLPEPAEDPKPPVPQLLTPANGTTGTSAVTFSWTTSPTAGIKNFDIICITGSLWYDGIIFNETVTGTSYAYNLPYAETTYRWRVRTRSVSGDFGGEVSYWHAPFTYTTEAPPPPPSTEYVIVDSGSGTGTDYLTLREALEAHNGRDLVAEGKTLIFECRASTSANDQGGSVVVSGFNTSEDFCVVISASTSAIGPRKFNFVSPYTISGYLLRFPIGMDGITILSDYVRLKGLATVDDVASGTGHGSRHVFVSGGKDVQILDMWCHQNTEDWDQDGVVAVDTEDFKAVNVWCERFTNFLGGTTSVCGAAIRVINDTGTPILYNCSAPYCRKGFQSSGCSAIAKNCMSDYTAALISDKVEFFGTWNTTASVLNYSANDATAPGLSAIHNLGSPDYIDPNGSPANDFHIDSTDSKIVFSGADLSLDSIFPFTDDCDYDDRSDRASWDIGADHIAGFKSRYIIDPDNGPGTDYTSLQTWQADSQRDLRVAKQNIIAACRSTSGSVDDFSGFDLNINGWNCSSAHNITISGMSGYRPKAYWQPSGAGAPYTIKSMNTQSLDIYEDYTIVDGIQFDGTHTGGTYAAYFRNVYHGRISNCFKINPNAGFSSVARLVSFASSQGKLEAYNNIVAGRRAMDAIVFDLDPWGGNPAVSTSGYCLNNTALSLSADGSDIINWDATSLADAFKTVIVRNNIVSGADDPMEPETGVTHPSTDYNLGVPGVTYHGWNPGRNSTRFLNKTRIHFRDEFAYDFRLSRFEWFAARWGEPNPSANGLVPEVAYDIVGKARQQHPGGTGMVNRDSWDSEHAPAAGSTMGPWSPPWDIVVVDTGGTGDYSSLAAWESDRQRDLTVEEVIETVVCKSTNGAPDTSNMLIGGWDTSDLYYIYILADPEHAHKGVWDDTKFRHITTSAEFFYIDEPYTVVESMQVLISGSDALEGIFVGGAGDESIVRNCLVKSDGSSNKIGIRSYGPSYLFNNIIYGLSGGSTQVGIYIVGTGTVVAHNTVIDCNTGIYSEAASGAILINNLAQRCTTNSYSNCSHGDNAGNMSDDGTAPGASAISAGTALFQNPSEFDFRLKFEVYQSDADAASAADNLPRRSGVVSLLDHPDYPVDYDICGTRRQAPSVSRGAHQCILRYISVVDKGGTGDYTELSTWESSAPAGSASLGIDLKIGGYCKVAECRNTVSGAFNFCSVFGWTPDAWHNIVISAASGHQHEGYWDDSKVRFESTTKDGLNINEEWTHVRGLQADIGGTDVGDVPFVSPSTFYTWYDSCFAKIDRKTGAAAYGFYLGDWQIASNCIVSGTSGYNSVGFYHGTSDVVWYINCLAIRCDAGFKISNDFPRYRWGVYVNCIETGSNVSGYASITSKAVGTSGSFADIWTNNISEDDTAPIPGTSTSGVVPVYMDINSDTRLSAGDTVAISGGRNLSHRRDWPLAPVLITRDAKGSTRPTSGAWSIGPDEPS
jgi:hypothetical protein